MRAADTLPRMRHGRIGRTPSGKRADAGPRGIPCGSGRPADWRTRRPRYRTGGGRHEDIHGSSRVLGTERHGGARSRSGSRRLLAAAEGNRRSGRGRNRKPGRPKRADGHPARRGEPDEGMRRVRCGSGRGGPHGRAQAGRGGQEGDRGGEGPVGCHVELCDVRRPGRLRDEAAGARGPDGDARHPVRLHVRLLARKRERRASAQLPGRHERSAQLDDRPRHADVAVARRVRQRVPRPPLP